MFQSTHPRGVRPKQHTRRKRLSLFQSTHPRGVRLVRQGIWIGSQKFQSTHPRGVRHATNRFFEGMKMFQSTHPRGVRLCGRKVALTGLFSSDIREPHRFRQKNRSGFPNVYNFTFVFNVLAMRASHWVMSVSLRFPFWTTQSCRSCQTIANQSGFWRESSAFHFRLLLHFFR